MASNARKHTIPAGGDQSITRATIFEAFGNSIRDVVPVANTTERAQVVSALTAKGEGPSASKPLIVLRDDAPGLHRLEYTMDGTTWLGSGTLFFASKAAADSFGTSNPGLLSIGDEARVGSARYLWSGTEWVITDTGWQTLTLNSGWSTYLGETPKYRVKNGWLGMSGRITAGAGAAQDFATLPVEARHTTTLLVFRSHGDLEVVGVTVASSGVCSVFLPGTSAPRPGVSLAPISYPVR